MKSCFFLILLFAFLAAGCAHSLDRPLTTNPSVAALPGLRVPVDATPEPTHPQSTEASVKPESGTVEGKDKTGDIQEQTGNQDDQLGDYAGKDEKAAVQDEHLGDYLGDEEPAVTIYDPLEPFNRAMYHFNDKFYFWALKPISEGYQKIVPEAARVCVQNFFYNLRFPIRFVSCLLQADLKCSGTELGRFVINSVWGIAGLLDLASDKDLNLKKQDVDLGQTLGFYGLGHGFYIVWPILGPSSARDSIAIPGDLVLYPVSYIRPWQLSLGGRGYDMVNDTSLAMGDYETLKEAALDPYEAIRDAYIQHRNRSKQAETPGAKHEQSNPGEVEAEKKGKND